MTLHRNKMQHMQAKAAFEIRSCMKAKVGDGHAAIIACIHGDHTLLHFQSHVHFHKLELLPESVHLPL